MMEDSSEEPKHTQEQQQQQQPQPTNEASDSNNTSEEDLQAARDIFYVKNPKDIRDGLAAGVGNFLKGGLGAAALIVSAPVKGAMDGSANGGGTLGAVKGFGLGLGMGLAGGAAMAVGGAVTGIYQIGRGIYNTPSAISESSQLKEWDPEKRQWYVYNLQEEAQMYLHMSEEQYIQQLLAEQKSAKKTGNDNDASKSSSEPSTSTPKAPAAPTRAVKENDYYDLLGVSPSATAGEIKKAYYIKARESHPDRHPDDPQAHTRFQAIGAAYQVLSDETLRANYDAHGKEGVENAPKMDSSTLFAMIFGSEKFEPLVGELKLASQMQRESESSADSNKPFADKLDALKQRQREITIALNLVRRLQPYLDNGQDKEEFLNLYREEVMELSKQPFGATLVNTIGTVYCEHAQSELSTVDSLSVSLMQAGRTVYTGVSVASESLRAALTANEVQKAQKKKEKKEGDSAETTADSSSSGAGSAVAASSAEEEAALKQKIDKLSGHMFTVLWYVTEMDIRSTLFHACRKVTRDRSVDETSLTRRCEALKILGELFVAHGKSSVEGLSDLLQRVKQREGAHTQENKEKENDDKAPSAPPAPPAAASQQAQQAQQQQQQQTEVPSTSAAAAAATTEVDLD